MHESRGNTMLSGWQDIMGVMAKQSLNLTLAISRWNYSIPDLRQFTSEICYACFWDAQYRSSYNQRTTIISVPEMRILKVLCIGKLRRTWLKGHIAKKHFQSNKVKVNNDGPLFHLI